MELDLTGKIALVTGGSAGIGLATAKLFATEGVDVHLVGRSLDRLEEARSQVVEHNDVTVTVQVADMIEPGAADVVATEALGHHGRVDILVNNAGQSQPLEIDSPAEAWERGLRLKFHSYRELAHALLPSMIEQQFGRIVNITGTSESDRLNASHPATAATHSWAKGLSRLVGRHGITVNSVPPNRVISAQTLEKNWPDEREREEHAREHIPMARFGDPEVVARTIAYLASPLTNFITGEIIHVDGGLRRFSF